MSDFITLADWARQGTLIPALSAKLGWQALTTSELASVIFLGVFVWPRLTPPPATAAKSKRIFQMRTYESPSEQAHIRKVEMFNSGEYACFQAAGFHPVFFGDTLIGSRMPCLTYMLSLSSLDEYNARWDAFRNHPDWKKLSANPRYSYEPIVSNITNLILSPLPSSQL